MQHLRLDVLALLLLDADDEDVRSRLPAAAVDAADESAVALRRHDIDIDASVSQRTSLCRVASDSLTIDRSMQSASRFSRISPRWRRRPPTNAS